MTGSRSFDGATDAIRFTLTSPNPTGAITLLAVIKPLDVDELDNVTVLTASRYTPEWGWTEGGIYLYDGSRSGFVPMLPTADSWQVFATSKPAGLARPIHHLVPLDGSGPPRHEPATSELPDVAPLLGWDLGTDDESWTDTSRWWYKGLIAGFAIFNRALTNAEVELATSWSAINALAPVRATRLDGEPPFLGQDMSRPLRGRYAPVSPPSFWPSRYHDTVMTDSPSAYFRLDETSGTAALDALGGASGAYVGGVSLGQPAVAPAAGGRAASFDAATRGYVRVADRTALDLGDTFTLEAWVRLDALDFRAIIDKGDSAYILRTTEDGRVLLRRNGRGDVVTSTVALTAGRVHHVVATKAAGVAKLYIDGVDVGGTVTNQTMSDTAHVLNIGAADAGTTNWLDGLIDEVALYKTALSAARVKAHYAAGIGTLVSRWAGSDWVDSPLDVWDGAAWRRTETINVT